MAQETVSFEFDGQALSATPGQSVAAALLNNGIVHLRNDEWGHAKGMACAIGVCWECRCIIDDRPNTRACMTEVREGMVVRRQNGLDDHV